MSADACSAQMYAERRETLAYTVAGVGAVAGAVLLGPALLNSCAMNPAVCTELSLTAVELPFGAATAGGTALGVGGFGSLAAKELAATADAAAAARNVETAKGSALDAKGVGADAAAGQAVPGAANFMGESDQFFKNVSKRSDIDSNGYFDVIAHGSTQKIEVVTSSGTIMADQRVVSRLIENNPAYSGQPIRLLSCDTGACDAGFAQSLANKMGVPVKAPTNLVWAYGDGKVVVAPRSPSNPNYPDLSKQGEFKIFNPGKP